MTKNRLIILTGPSGIGKTPLDHALQKFFPEIRNPIKKIVLYNSRKPRPAEQEGIDYYFKPAGYINRFRRNPRFVVADVRGDVQALDIEELSRSLKKKTVLFEGNTPVALEIIHRLSADSSIAIFSVFLSPLSKIEIQTIQKSAHRNEFRTLLTTMMYNKLLRRLHTFGRRLTAPERENLSLRATEAYAELQEAWRFDWVIPNHDGEDSDNWNIMPYPIGDARTTLHTFADLIKNKKSDLAEKWDKNIIP